MREGNFHRTYSDITGFICNKYITLLFREKCSLFDNMHTMHKYKME